MTDTSYPLELLRAELKSAMAEQLVQLMDRFASKRDLADIRAELLDHIKADEDRFATLDAKVDTLLAVNDRAVGAEEVKGKHSDFLKNAFVVIVASVLGAVIGSGMWIIWG